jgi:tetratricopeptide (TPR) repeat protein
VPQINAVDDVFILQASLVDPTTGHTADRIRITAKGSDQVLLESIDELTRTVRRRLGESLRSISETDPPFVQYTTSSWEALRLVALASNQWAATQWSEAANSFELALEEDPEFAIARASLGLLQIQFMGQQENGKEMLVQALADASEISRREFLLLRAVNRQFVDEDLDGALADYRLVSDLYPDTVAPYNNSGRILQGLGRYEEAVRMYDRARAVDPRSIFPVHNMWWVLNQNLLRPVEAEEAARTMVDLQPENPWSHHALGWTMVSLRRFDEAEEQMRAVLEIDPNHPFAVANLGHLLYRRGAFEEAATIYRGIYQRSQDSEQIDTDIYDSLCLGLALQGAGRIDEAHEILNRELAEYEANIREGAETGREICLLAALGRSREARSLARGFKATDPTDPHQFLVLAEIYSLAGDSDAAVQALERAFEVGFDDPYYILINPPLAGIQNEPAIDRLAPVS